MEDARKSLERLLERAEVEINGDRPWDPQIHRNDFYSTVFSGGSLALGEAYMEGWWDCEALDEFFFRVLNANLDEKVKNSWYLIFEHLRAKFLNLQSQDRASIVGEEHYDVGNDLFNSMLDSRMVYSCGYWRRADELDEAQEDKLDLICRKLNLKEGMRLLDIGCGWGSFVEYAANNYDIEAVGITISEEQEKLARERCKDLPVEIRYQDYRDVEEEFDRIVSIGMFEHVGYKNYDSYMETVHRCLAGDGLSLLHTIGNHDPSVTTDPWIDKYIFPNGMIPSAGQVVEASEDYFIIEDWHNFGPDYDKTLMSWYENFEDAWDELAGNYSEEFYRMWTYYLQMTAGSFRARKNNVWQIVFSPRTIARQYRSVR